jgi:NAD(P)-dependent dehydrogenase (short-subunit alcohol dehydrogenase family)
MKVLVVGATGGSGCAAVDELLLRGHEVTAFSRHATTLGDRGGQLHAVNGDATDPAAVDRVVRGQQAVIVTLGISQNALRVRLLGSPGTPMDVRSRGTRNVIAAMRRYGVGKLVVQTAYGVGATRGKLPPPYRLLYWLVLRPQIADTELQEHAVRTSGLDWVIAQPVSLTDDPQAGLPFASPAGELGGMKVSRGCVGRFLVQAAEGCEYAGRSVALSAAVALSPATRSPAAGGGRSAGMLRDVARPARRLAAGGGPAQVGGQATLGARPCR